MIFDRPAKRYMLKKQFEESYKRDYDIFSLSLYQDIYDDKKRYKEFMLRLIKHTKEQKPEMLDYLLIEDKIEINEYKDICDLISIKGDNNE